MRTMKLLACAVAGLVAITVATCSKSGSPTGPGGGNTPPDSAGVAWTARTLPNSLQGYDVVWGGSKFVAVGVGGGAVSADGTTWTGTTGLTAQGVCYGNASYVASGFTKDAWRSTDGVNWQTATPDVAEPSWDLRFVTYDAGSFWAYGSYYVPGIGGYWQGTSADGSAWSISKGLTLSDVRRVIAHAPGDATGPITLRGGSSRVSGPGYTTSLSPTALVLNDVAYGDGWVIVADSGVIFTSTNGVAWNRVATPVQGTVKHLRAVVWTGSLFVAVGNLGTVLTSPTGATWTQRTSGVTYDLRGVAWSGQKLVAIGIGGILTSP